MSSNAASRRCSATTKAGEPCKAYAVRGSQLCAAHSRSVGAPAGNQNRLVHGFYAKPEPKPIVTVDEAIASLGRQLTRAEEIMAETQDLEAWNRIFALHTQALSRLGRLLRDQRALSGESSDGLLEAVSKLMDEINTMGNLKVTL